MLGRQGHDVIVFDRAPDVAKGTSEANGAQLSYSYVEPFASPGILKTLPKYLFGLDPAIRFGFSFSPDYWLWGLKFLANCRPSKFEDNYQSRIALASYSREILDLVQGEIKGSSLTGSGRGKIVLLKSETALNRVKSSFDRHNSSDLSLKLLRRKQCLEIEPTLASWQGDYAGGLYGEQDTALDTQIFCKTLKDASIGKFGTKYNFATDVQGIESKTGGEKTIITNKGQFICDAVVLCTGHQSNHLLNSIGMRLSSYPMQGYSLTLPATSNKASSSITDAHHKVVFANLGEKVRIAGFMDANLSQAKTSSRAAQLKEIARRLWPDIADFNAEPHYWSGFRPMMPSGVPVIKETRIQGVYLNAGHGSLGYTFALGSAMKMAKLIGHDKKNEFA